MLRNFPRKGAGKLGRFPVEKGGYDGCRPGAKKVFRLGFEGYPGLRQILFIYLFPVQVHGMALTLSRTACLLHLTVFLTTILNVHLVVSLKDLYYTFTLMLSCSAFCFFLLFFSCSFLVLI